MSALWIYPIYLAGMTITAYVAARIPALRQPKEDGEFFDVVLMALFWPIALPLALVVGVVAGLLHLAIRGARRSQ